MLGVGLFYKGKFIDALKEIQKCKQATAEFNSSDPRRQELYHWEKVINDEIIRSPTSDQTLQAGKVVYEWRQTENKVYIEIIYSIQQKSDLKVRYENDKCEVFFPLSEYKSFELNLDLFDAIIPDECKHNILLDRIEIQLEKKNKGQAWKMLEKETSQNEQVLENDGPKKISQKIRPHDPRKWKNIEKEIDARRGNTKKK